MLSLVEIGLVILEEGMKIETDEQMDGQTLDGQSENLTSFQLG